jgi:hypothetical protein
MMFEALGGAAIKNRRREYPAACSYVQFRKILNVRVQKVNFSVSRRLQEPEKGGAEFRQT